MKYKTARTRCQVSADPLSSSQPTLLVASRYRGVCLTELHTSVCRNFAEVTVDELKTSSLRRSYEKMHMRSYLYTSLQ